MDALRELLAAGQTQNARKEAERLLAQDPEHLEARITLAKAHLVEGELIEAERHIAEVEKRAPGSTDLLLLRANLAAQRNDTDTAKALYQQATQRTPAPAEAFYGLGCMLAFEEKLRESLKAFEKAVELAPKAGIFRYHLAQNLIRVDQPARAVEQLERSITLNPFYPPAYLLFARILTILNKLEDARHVLREGLKVMPDEPRLLAELTNVSTLGGDVGGAFEAAAKLAAAHPDDAAAQANLANLLLAQGRYEEVLRICRGMEKRGLATAPLKNIEATVYEARTPPDFDSAVRAYEEAMTLDPTDWTSANNLGVLLLRRQDGVPERHVARAITVLEEALRRKPGQIEPMLNLALAYARANQKVKAKELTSYILDFDLPANNPLRQEAERLAKALR